MDFRLNCAQKTGDYDPKCYLEKVHAEKEFTRLEALKHNFMHKKGKLEALVQFDAESHRC